ncbi:GGDEF domain-containing protein [Pseudomaricurvus sp.]|uniref:GGDEF domain-containing protein n=1 Tax=Pseudomaricurvus sp. TaxID=2004510 RepID=UPI003F6A6155
MATLTGQTHHAETSKEDIIRLSFPVNQDDVVEVRSRLTQSLQTSLDLNIVLELFFQQIQTLIPLSGIKYTHQQKDCQTLLGSDDTHKLDYRLNTAQDDLGEIVFHRSKRFNEHEMAVIESLLSTLVCPLRNALLYRDALQSALRDPLTGVGNRVALDQAHEREVQLAARHKQPLSLLAIDIDHFKSINDRYGHSSGDDVIRQIAQSIKAVTRCTDLVFRYGGEEFVVLLNKTALNGAHVIAERIRQHVESLRIESYGAQISTTISIGISTLNRNNTDSMLFQRADAALYKAKQLGRNRVEATV